MLSLPWTCGFQGTNKCNGDHEVLQCPLRLECVFVIQSGSNNYLCFLRVKELCTVRNVRLLYRPISPGFRNMRVLKTGGFLIRVSDHAHCLCLFCTLDWPLNRHLVFGLYSTCKKTNKASVSAGSLQKRLFTDGLIICFQMITPSESLIVRTFWTISSARQFHWSSGWKMGVGMLWDFLYAASSLHYCPTASLHSVLSERRSFKTMNDKPQQTVQKSMQHVLHSIKTCCMRQQAHLQKRNEQHSDTKSCHQKSVDLESFLILFPHPG